MTFRAFGLLPLLAIGLCLGLGTASAGAAETRGILDGTKDFDDLTHAEKTAAKAAARKKKLQTLRVCADPGNMPLSDLKREGFQNKVVEILARAMDTQLIYFWRPYLERGLTRETFANDECDILLDMPADYESLLTTTPIYRTTYVLAYRDDSNLHIETLDDPKLKELRLGVFQHSGMRLALAKHGVTKNVAVHVISHDADLEPGKQPWRQVQEVIDGKLDIAAVWGPFAGFLKAMHGAPLTLQPVNLMEDETPLEFDLAFGMRKTDAVLKYMLDAALEHAKDEIKEILTAYGVPLVQCSKCVVSGDIPAHGSFFTHQQERARRMFLEALPAERITLDKKQATPDQIVTEERLDNWLQEGADLTQELANAVLASDQARVQRLLDKGADIDKLSLQGLAPLHAAARQRDSAMLDFLIKHGANIDAPDKDGWTALAHAAFRNHVPSVELLAGAGANVEAAAPGEAGSPGFTPLAIALAEGKFFAAKALLDAGASVNAASGLDRLTPLMLIASQAQAERRAQSLNQGPSSVEIAKLLIAKGADVNARSKKGVTPLMVAAAHDNAPLAGVLIQAGADVAAKTESGQTALDIAKANQNASAEQQIELLIRAKTTKAAADTLSNAPATEPPAGQ